MAEFDEQRKRLTVKVVYYGPALSGKTTNLVRMHDMLAPEMIGDMMTLETDGLAATTKRKSQRPRVRS